MQLLCGAPDPSSGFVQYYSNTYLTGVWSTGEPAVDTWDGVSLPMIWIGFSGGSGSPYTGAGYFISPQSSAALRCGPSTAYGYGNNSPVISCGAGSCAGMSYGLFVSIAADFNPITFVYDTMYVFRGDGATPADGNDSQCLSPSSVDCGGGIVAQYTNVRIWKVKTVSPFTKTLLTSTAQFIWSI